MVRTQDPGRWYRRTALLALCLATVTVAPASSVRSVNLEQMAGRAATIFSGRCVDVRVELDPSLGRDVTLVTFEVHRAIKGEVGRRHTIRLAGGNGDRSRWSVPGLPSFRQDEEIVVFLYGESASGFTSPVGFGQGKFGVVRDKLGRPTAVNGFSNAHLFRGLSGDAADRLNVVRPDWKKRRGLSPDQLLDLAETLNRTAP